MGAAIDDFIKGFEQRDLLRLLTCGSVDDGKSTVIGRLLHDTRSIYEDHFKVLAKDSAKHGTTGEAVDLALLVDGLKAEREQGITIDVAYRYFSTDKRKFVIADCPGHEQYTRNMATGASGCDLALILIDARKGVLQQTKRHSFIVSLLGIRHVVVLVNKMDLVNFDQAVFDEIVRQYRDFAAKLEFGDVQFIPMVAKDGDNVVEAGNRMPWYRGGSLLHHLETAHIASDHNLIDMRFPVQYVLRPNSDFRGFAGSLASGVLRRGDEVVVLPSQKRTRVRSLVTFEGEIEQAVAPMAVTLTLESEVDVSRGDMLVPPHNQPLVTHDLEAMVVWLSENPMVIGKDYLIKHTTHTVSGQVTRVRYGIDVNSGHRVEQESLGLNQIGRCTFTTPQPLMIDNYRKNRATGAFIVIDTLSNNTVGAGMVDNRPTGAIAKGLDVDGGSPSRPAGEGRVLPVERALRFRQEAATVLFTGAPGSGHEELAFALERHLFDRGHIAAVLDKKMVGSDDLLRVAEAARLLNASGVIALGAWVVPNAAARRKIAEMVGKERCLVVQIEGPVQADGLHEPLQDPDLLLQRTELLVEEKVERVLQLLRQRGIIR